MKLGKINFINKAEIDNNYLDRGQVKTGKSSISVFIGLKKINDNYLAGRLNYLVCGDSEIRSCAYGNRTLSPERSDV